MKYKSKVLITISICILIIGSIMKSYNLSEMFGISSIGKSIGKEIKKGVDKASDAVGSITQGSIDKLINDTVSKVKNDKNIMKPINEFKNITSQTKNEIKSTVDSMINVLTKDINEIKSSIDKLPDQVLKTTNSLIDDMKTQIDNTTNEIIEPIKESVNEILDVFGKMTPVFIELFNVFKDMTNIMTSTFSFLIGIINRLKKCNLAWIKSRSIRARFRETMAKMFEILVLQLQLLQPMNLSSTLNLGGYLHNIQKKQMELNKIMITNLSLDWADFTKLDIQGCIGLKDFMDLGKSYIDNVGDIADKIKKLSEKVLDIIGKLRDAGVNIVTTSIPINLDFLGLLKNPWTQQELDASNAENQNFQKTIIEYVSDVTKQSVDSILEITKTGLSTKHNYTTTELKQSVDT